MTHNELLEALNNELKRAQWEGECHNSGWEEGVLALIAVVELHKPAMVNHPSYCLHCEHDPNAPCATIKAILEKLS